MDRELYQQIVSEYRKSGSVDITAKACGTYPIKVRKVLITEGIWHSRKSDAVNALRKRGYSVPEIAEELGMDEKNVQFYLPYTESSLSGEKSDTGERVRSFRERSRNAAEGSAAREKEMESPANDPVNRLEKGPVKYPTEERDLFFGGSRSVSMAESARPFGGSQREIWTGYMLRAEMVSFSCDPDCDCTDIFDGGKDAEILKTLLKSRNGIIRDLIVPGTMTLHQLSYALLKAFGFQNCHLHHFEFPKKLLRQLTGNRTKDWAELCGVYLHAPVDEDFEDLYWDDDYREGKSPNAWMRSKYTGEAADYAVGETYIDTLRLM